MAEITTAERFFRLAREAHREGRQADADFYRQAAINAKVRDGQPVHDHDVRPISAHMPAQFQGDGRHIEVEPLCTFHSDRLGRVTIPEE
jgi:hypothetical protein